MMLAALCAACTAEPGASPPAPMSNIPGDERPPDWEQLRRIAGDDVREGVLESNGDGVTLSLHRGDSARPFLAVSSPDRREPCWQPDASLDEPHEEGVRVGEASSWWLFSDFEQTVGLEFAADDVAAWFWDDERSCAKRIPAIADLEVNDATPPEYYKADDVQVGYRWNYLHQAETGPVMHELDGDYRVEIGAVDGVEQLVVERDTVSILAEDGRALLHEEFEVDPNQPCYNSQLSVFREPDGGLYSVISWESFGTAQSCQEASGGTWYRNIIAEWRPRTDRFETTYRIADRTEPREGGESTSLDVEIRQDVLGGTLRLQMHSSAEHREARRERCTEREAGSGTCLSYQTCWEWDSARRRKTEYRLIASDGPTLELGQGQRTMTERVRDCAPVHP